VGLLATNSIRGGANRAVLDRIKASGDVFMAWADKPWVLEGASVRISIVSFDDGAEQERYLDGRPVTAITSGLTVGADLSLARRLSENESIAFIGDQPTGPFDVPEEIARVWMALPPNPNGRSNADVLRPFVGGADIVRRNQRRWIVDFGVDMPEDEAALYEAPFEYVREHVRPTRATNKVAKLRDVWWLHWNPRPHMRAALHSFSRYIVTPHVSRHRIFVWLDQGTLPSNLLIAFARDDDYFFGVLHSRAHELWALRMGTSLEDRPRYTPTTCFETFPLPWPPGEEPEEDPVVQEISAAAKRLDKLRLNWLSPESASEAELKKRTLTNLYNQRPTWLANAHEQLDRAVFAAYGWSATISEDEILKNLLELNAFRLTNH
jgi:type II restriction/modification system DNA methylase subunit YeeA